MRLLFRVDASTIIGSGHFMRCLALAQACLDSGGKVTFIMFNETPLHLEELLVLEDIYLVKIDEQIGSYEDAKITIDLAKQLDIYWLVIDGYNFDAEYQRLVKNAGLNVLFIDDYGHAEYYYADLVLNQNISANAELYAQRTPYTQLLLGKHYILLRREFRQWQKWRRTHKSIASKLLVTMGGSDADNVTFKVLQSLNLIPNDTLEVVAVVGGSNSHYEQLQSMSQKSPLSIYLRRNVKDMPQLMAWADIAITAGGSTCWELAFMGLPSIILVVAENQREAAKKLNDINSMNLGWYKQVSDVTLANIVTEMITSTQIREEMTRRGTELVDGKGSDRILMCLAEREITYESKTFLKGNIFHEKA